ncbi:hypothetical protein LCGC14_0150680 [marine sediment metagenome]|uniref:Flagellar protein FlaG protein n=1 Tax=marine sediment metagenome TaxID=412755 RepID=A0A0F9Y0I3_9ZZZZ|nr:flagellar protein FlaG [Halomonas sp.]HDZ47903.1 flagellar protein FlaG [Halomonas sp.]HEB03548.1 flagellar protein FlaG [Halomonas sp.]
MSTLPIESAMTLLPSSLSNLSPRQQLESTLDQLTTKNSQLVATEADNQPIASSELVEPIQKINDIMRPRGLEFELSEETSRIITRVIDRESGDVIREIPPEEVVRIAERLETLQGQIISLEA